MMGKWGYFICGVIIGVGLMSFLFSAYIIKIDNAAKELYEPPIPKHHAWTVSVTYTDGSEDVMILHKDNDTGADLSIMLNVNGCIQTFSETEKPEVYGQNETILLCGVGSFVLLDTKQIETPIELH